MVRGVEIADILPALLLLTDIGLADTGCVAMSEHSVTPRMKENFLDFIFSYLITLFV